MIAVTHLLAAASVCLPHIVETGVAHTSCASPIHQRQSDRESDPMLWIAEMMCVAWIPSRAVARPTFCFNLSMHRKGKPRVALRWDRHGQHLSDSRGKPTVTRMLCSALVSTLCRNQEWVGLCICFKREVPLNGTYPLRQCKSQPIVLVL